MCVCAPRKLDLSKTDFSGDSESETERIVFNENPVAKFIEVDGVGKVGELVTSCQVNLSEVCPIHYGTLLTLV